MPVVAAAVIGAGATVYGASQAKKAANKAENAQTQAATQQIAAQQAALDKIIGLNQNAINGGNLSLNQLLAELGVTSNGSTTAAAPAPQLSYDPAGNVIQAPQAASTVAAKAAGGPAGTSPVEDGSLGGSRPSVIAAQGFGGNPNPTIMPQAQPDPSAYLQQWPDVAQEYAHLQSTPEGQARLAQIGVSSPEQFANYHYQEFGQAAGREMPVAVRPADPAPQTQAQQTDPYAPPDLTNAGRPQAATAPDFSGRAPDLNSFFSNFEADPGAAYRRSEALGGVNAASAARGKLRSGDAVKALATLSSDLASQEYNNWFNRQNTLYNNSRNAFQNDRAYDTSAWQYGVDRGDRNFNTDRTYQTSQDNTRMSNLFDVARLGQQAAGNVSGATTNNANNMSSIYGSQANAASDAAYARANANAGLVGGLAGTATNLFANWGGTTGGTGKATNTGNWASGSW